MHRCVARTIAMLIHDFMKFRLLALLGLIPNTPPMKPRRERSDGVGLDSLGGISALRARGKEGQILVSDKCWMVHQDSLYARPECNPFGVSGES